MTFPCRGKRDIDNRSLWRIAPGIDRHALSKDGTEAGSRKPLAAFHQ
ncbi:hypothetical protein BLA13014_00088 [Burkholderia aenigmatica]|uniref:Uncharacterized protein n=1 Tax=Burkholderia aenigmatica TaxID=2015348 RepID=A0A6P2GW68_9BURK|nr:hypothetical protein BLA13014_00088 [Burkholderia aenigmatica]